MSRPEEFEHLTDYQRQGHKVAMVFSDQIIRYPSLGLHLLAALAEADRLGLEVENGEIVIPLTTAELDSKLAQAQRNWESSAKSYADALADPAGDLPEWRRQSINGWAEENGRTAIVWPDDAEAVPA